MSIAQNLHILDRIRVLNKIIERSSFFKTESAILRSLHILDGPKRLSPKEIMQQVPISSGALTTAIGRLEKQNLIMRVENEEDGRGQFVQLTKNGQSFIESQSEALENFVQNAFEGFDDIELLRLQKLLRKLTDNLG